MMKPFLCGFFFLITIGAFGQKELIPLRLEDAVRLAQNNSISSKVTRNRFLNSHWAYRSLQADLKPQLLLSADPLPAFNRAIDVVTLPDGRDAFINRSLMRNSLGLTIEQYVGLTGGNIFVGTSLQRLDIFGDKSQTSYYSAPLSIGISQPLFQFDPLAWEKKIAPIVLEESKSIYAEEMERIASEAVRLFFAVLTAQFDLNAARTNRSVTDTLYRITEERFRVGSISKTELLQLELKSKDMEVAEAEALLTLQTSSQELNYLLGMQRPVELIAPSDIPNLLIDSEKALEQARVNRSDPVRAKRTVLEAKRDIDEAKRESGLRVSIMASFGLSQTSSKLQGAYSDLLDQEQVNVSLQLPIADWGKAKARREVASSNYDLVQSQNDEELLRFEQEITTSVQQVHILRHKIGLAERSYEIAKVRSGIARQRYLISKISIIELNLALEDEERSRIQYLNSIKDFWIAYYEVRRLTLYDFISQQPLFRTMDIN